MTRRLINWLGKHQVLAISTLNAGLLLCLAIAIGVATTRNKSNSLVWALDTTANTQARGELLPAEAGRQPHQQAPMVLESFPLPEKTLAGEEPVKLPALKPVEVIEPPASPTTTSTVPPASVRQELATGSPAIEELQERPEPQEQAPDLKPVEKRGFPVRSTPSRPDVRALRARPVPPTQRGRILRPRQ